MNLNVFKRWKKMVDGSSSFHVKQGEGLYFSTTEIKGYYNDLRNKVLSNTALLDENGIPYNINCNDEKVYFPGTIFQYALGLYDLYLEKNSKEYKENFISIANWTLQNQKENGMWDCMKVLGDKLHQSQSSMCQSQGVSVLIRAYTLTKLEKYLKPIDKATDILVKNKNNGGTCYYNKEKVIFQEYVSEIEQSVLNGWIFSIFGLYDYYILTKKENIKKIIDATVDTLASELKKYDRKYWSSYDQVGTIASPAYHDLHIQQLAVLEKMFDKDEFGFYKNKFTKYQRNIFFKSLAILTKIKQKMKKSKYYDISISLVR